MRDEEFVAKGYRFYPANDRSDFCIGHWAKWETHGDLNHRLYCVEAYVYLFPDRMKLPGGNRRVSFKTRLYWPGSRQVEFEPLTEADDTIETMEAFFRESYERLGCVPDRMNNDLGPGPQTDVESIEHGEIHLRRVAFQSSWRGRRSRGWCRKGPRDRLAVGPLGEGSRVRPPLRGPPPLVSLPEGLLGRSVPRLDVGAS